MAEMGKIMFFVAALIVATARSVHAIDPKAAGGEVQSYIVHMDPTKVQIPDSMNPASWYASFIRDAVMKAGALNDDELAESSILYTYDTVLTGFAAKLSGKQVTAIKAMDGFMGAYPDKVLKLHTTYTPQFLGLKRGQGLWSESTGYASDVIVGVIDTGVWPEHPSFADHKTQTPVPSRWKGHCEVGRVFNASNCNKKLIGARFFYKGYESDNGPIDETVEYKSPRDSLGHGTHTASTAAGNVVPGASVLGYAKGSASGMAPGARVEYGVFYSSKANVSLLGYTDSDWVGDCSDRWSTAGYIFQLGSGPISWSSKNLRALSLSSCEVEYRAAKEAAKEVVWIRHVLTELGIIQKSSTTLRCDN